MARRDAEIDATVPEAILIGAYLFLPDRRELRANDGESTILPEPGAQVLSRLAAAPNETVPEDALTDAIRAAGAAASLETCLAQIRRALGDSDRRLVETVPGRGVKLHAQPVARTGEEAPAATPPPPRGMDAKGKPMAGLISLLFVLLLTALVLYLLVWPDTRTPSESALTAAAFGAAARSAP